MSRVRGERAGDASGRAQRGVVGRRLGREAREGRDGRWVGGGARAWRAATGSAREKAAFWEGMTDVKVDEKGENVTPDGGADRRGCDAEDDTVRAAGRAMHEIVTTRGRFSEI